MAATFGPNRCEVTPDGDDDNSGVFWTTSTGTDYSQQDAAQYSGSDLTADPTDGEYVRSPSVACSSDQVGNAIRIITAVGTWVPGIYQIREITNRGGTDYWRLGVGTGIAVAAGELNTSSWSIGGRLKTPGAITLIDYPSVEVRVYVKSATYTITTSTYGPSGPMKTSVRSNTLLTVEGFLTTPGDFAGRFTMDAGSITGLTTGLVYLISTIYGGQHRVYGCIADGQNGAGNIGFYATDTDNATFWCKAVDCPSEGFHFVPTTHCEADTCGIGFATRETQVYSWAHDCTGNGFGNGNRPLYCLATNNGGDGFVIGTTLQGEGGVVGLIAHGNSGHGIELSRPTPVVDCIVTNNGLYGVLTHENATFIRVASRGNTSGRHNHAASPSFRDLDPILLTADPYEDAANDDYNINNVAGGGALIRAAAFTIPAIGP